MNEFEAAGIEFHRRLAEPQKATTILEAVISEGFPEDLVRSKFSHMLADRDIHVRYEGKIVNGPEHNRQLALPGFDTDEEAYRERRYEYWRPWRAVETLVFEANLAEAV